MTDLVTASAQPDTEDWNGPKIRYDLVKEFVIALAVVGVLVTVLAIVFSSPDEHPVTIRQWATSDPTDFLTTALSELNGNSTTATYGAPFNDTPGAGQKIGPISLANLSGVRLPIDTAKDFVLAPLGRQSSGDPGLRDALAIFERASSSEHQGWEKAYGDALGKTTANGSEVSVPNGDYGPLGPMMSGLLSMAQAGNLDADLLLTPQFYGTDYTKPLMFLSDGSFLADRAHSDHLSGTQWGMTNETGNYPGQAWLWLYTMWYQVPPFTHTGNADALIWSLMMLLTLVLLLVPVIPGLRSIPRLVPVYRLIWREHYRKLRQLS